MNDGAGGDVVLIVTGGRKLAVPTVRVREVSAASMVTPVPTAPPPVAGLTQLRGQILPVIDLGEESPRTPKPGDPLVVVELGPVRAALVCDQVVGVSGDAGDVPILDVGAVFDALRGKVAQVGA